MVRTMRNHEAAHAVAAIDQGLPLNTITQCKVTFPLSAAQHNGYRVAIAAGCLGEFYECWMNCMQGNHLNSLRGKPLVECETPIQKALDKFSQQNYPDDFNAYTINGHAFDRGEFLDYLNQAWGIVQSRWRDIIHLSARLETHSSMTYDEVLSCLSENSTSSISC